MESANAKGNGFLVDRLAVRSNFHDRLVKNAFAYIPQLRVFDAQLGAERVRFVLVAPSHAGNIGAAARALKVMGFTRLAVVAPRARDFRTHPEAIAFAAGAADVLAAATEHATLVDALAEIGFAYAMTGYAREFGPPLIDLQAATATLAARIAQTPLAFVFGTERSGLANEDAERCQQACAIAVDQQFGSLNLAQAVQVTAYECRRALAQHARVGIGVAFAEEAPATIDRVEGLLEHWQRALLAIDYVDPAQPKRLLSRLRRFVNRAHPTATEVDLLRGIAKAILAPRSAAPAAAARAAANAAPGGTDALTNVAPEAVATVAAKSVATTAAARPTADPSAATPAARNDRPPRR